MSLDSQSCKAFVLFLIFGTLLTMTSGCGEGGGDGPPIYPISGTVTFQGKPVPRGTISMEPDSSQGGTGPSLSMEIHNGKYTSSRGQGTRGGAYLVLITGFDGVPTSSPAGGMENPEGNPLFPLYHTTVELPTKPHEQDFEVPANPAQN